ncbi:hypothetical protein [Dankookia sp. P2]|uniref:hypothetical protein n=1 Tax=Dankookia sp. P2 TaxID=3423955 RepID=UPI003D66E2D8
MRTDAFDYDMTVGGAPQSLSPGNEQRDFWTCAEAQKPGSQNLSGICDPVVDALVELLIAPPPTGPSWSPAPGRWTACCSGTTT